MNKWKSNWLETTKSRTLFILHWGLQDYVGFSFVSLQIDTITNVTFCQVALGFLQPGLPANTCLLLMKRNVKNFKQATFKNGVVNIIESMLFLVGCPTPHTGYGAHMGMVHRQYSKKLSENFKAFNQALTVWPSDDGRGSMRAIGNFLCPSGGVCMGLAGG
jgi:hypothetical protein